MKIWLDALTPKQLLFGEYIMRRGTPDHTFLFTSRRYSEVEELATIRGLKPTYVGRFGGGKLATKLDASLERATLLSGLVQRFGPDASISFGSPEAARVSFGLAVPHMIFCNSPHQDAICRLSIPLATRLLIPHVIPKPAVSRYGIHDTHIIQYKALDEAAIMQNPPVMWDPTPAGIRPDHPSILFRMYETQASYVSHTVETGAIIEALVEHFPAYDIVVSGRYPHQIRQLQSSHPNCIILERAVDGRALLDMCDVFVGSGGTMTTEAALRGIRAISYQAVSSIIESHLVERGVLCRASTPGDIVREAERLLGTHRTVFKRNGESMLSEMEDIYGVVEAQLSEMTRDHNAGVSPE